MDTDRRSRRSNIIPQALRFQLDAAASRVHLSAVILTDDDGLIVASTGDGPDHEELATLAPTLVEAGHPWHGTLQTEHGSRFVTVRALATQWGTLYMMGIGGFGPGIHWELHNSGKGVARILS